MTTADERAREEALTRYPHPEDNVTLRSLHELLRGSFSRWQRPEPTEQEKP